MLCVSVVLLETVNVTCCPTFTDLAAGKNASAAMPFLSLPALTVSPLGTPWPATSFLASLDAALACFLIACLSCFFVVMCAFLAFTTTVPFMPGCSAQNTVYVPCLVNFTLKGFGGPAGGPEPTSSEPSNVWPPAGAAGRGARGGCAAERLRAEPRCAVEPEAGPRGVLDAGDRLARVGQEQA